MPEYPQYFAAQTKGNGNTAGDVTVLLGRWKDGDRQAFDELVPIVYPHLRNVAGAFMRREARDHILQATALVHELFLRLRRQRQADWNDRAHFYAFAARMMRMILTDHARSALADKRGGDAIILPVHEDLAWVNVHSVEMIDLGRALDELAELDARKAQTVELRYFLGLSDAEAAELLGVSVGTVERDLRLARSWLYDRLRGTSDEED